jgi:hypothetical protein
MLLGTVMMMMMMMMIVFLHVSPLCQCSSLSAGSLSRIISQVKGGFPNLEVEIPL